MCTFPNHQSLQSVPASACKHCFGKELTELDDGSDYYVNACGHYRLLANTHTAIDMGEQEATAEMHAVISGPTPAGTGWEMSLSSLGEKTTTPSRELCKDPGAMESVLILESTQASDDESTGIYSSIQQSPKLEHATNSSGYTTKGQLT